MPWQCGRARRCHCLTAWSLGGLWKGAGSRQPSGGPADLPPASPPGKGRPALPAQPGADRCEAHCSGGADEPGEATDEGAQGRGQKRPGRTSAPVGRTPRALLLTILSGFPEAQRFPHPLPDSSLSSCWMINLGCFFKSALSLPTSPIELQPKQLYL